MMVIGVNVGMHYENYTKINVLGTWANTWLVSIYMGLDIKYIFISYRILIKTNHQDHANMKVPKRPNRVNMSTTLHLVGY